MSSFRHRALATGLIAAIASAAGLASDATRVSGEPSRSVAPKSADAWRAPPAAARTARLRYGEMSAERILRLQQDNAGRVGKPLQIGIRREAAIESPGVRLPPLSWTVLADGSQVTHIELASPLAYGIRAGLQLVGLDPRAQLRFAGSARPGTVVAVLRGAQAAALIGDDGLFWTPGTDGETQLIEVWLPAGASHRGVAIQAPRLSHLMSNAIDDFKIVKNIGASASCNIDAVCKVGELGLAYSLAKAAVARITFVRGGSTYLCSGTLLNDTDASTQTPWFHTADHCISTQAVASTLNSYWNYEATACGNATAAPQVQLSGGADYLYSNSDTDGALLRLRDAAPAGAYHAGWDAGALPEGIDLVAIHHPAGDLKKVSLGRHLPARDYVENIAAGWLQGTTEGGSSGSGLFTVDGGQYHLRGGLYGGDASCASSGSLADPDNVDWYSRLSLDFAAMRQYLAPVQAAPRRRAGAQPLMPRR